MRNGERSRLPLFSPAERLVLASILLITVAVHLLGWWQSRRVASWPTEQTVPVLPAEVDPGAETVPGAREGSQPGDSRPAPLPAVQTGEVTPANASAREAGPAAASSGPSPGQLPPSLAPPPEHRQPVAGPRQQPSSSRGQAVTSASNRAEMVTGRDTATGPAPSTTSRPVSLNQADAAELEALPGIGPALARRIIEYREQHGPFRSVEELQDVPGIGEARLRELRSWVTVP